MKKKDKQIVGLTEDEKAAMRETLEDQRKAAKGQSGETMLLEKIADMQGLDKALAEKIHKIVKEVAPQLTSKTWYGMPAYANKEGKVICFFQSAGKFKARYATLGFSDSAVLDEGNMWPTSFALTKLTSDEEKKIAELVKKAAG